MRKQKIVSIVLGIFVVASAAALAVYAKPKPKLNSMRPRSIDASPKVEITATTSTPATYTLMQVAAHKDASSCWTTINGAVYDVTPWISAHPGGASAILSLCGTDGSVAFNEQHGGKSRPANELAAYKIGALK